MKIKQLADRTAAKYRTRDPYELARALDVIVIDTPLQGVRGFCHRISRCKIIYIDNSLDDWQRRIVCAHELGHLLMHKDLNRIYMDNHTYLLSSRYEREADKFAVCYLYDDDYIQQLQLGTIQQASVTMGVPEPLAEYRMLCTPPTLFQDTIKDQPTAASVDWPEEM